MKVTPISNIPYTQQYNTKKRDNEQQEFKTILDNVLHHKVDKTDKICYNRENNKEEG